MVFVAHYVREQHEAIRFLHQADGNTGHRVGDGHARIHERQGAAADAGHAAGAVGLENVRDDADGVWELVGAWDHRLETAFGQGAVADFAPARPADRPAFTDRKGREVVVEHEFLAVLLDQTVHALLGRLHEAARAILEGRA